MKKLIIYVFITMTLGIVTAKVVYSKTMEKRTVNDKNLVYFLELGTYDDKKLLESDTKNIDSKIVEENNGKYLVHVGISKKKDNLKKISKLYQKKGYNLYILKKNIINQEFLINLEQFDKLIESSKTNEEVSTINTVILSSYEEMVLS